MTLQHVKQLHSLPDIQCFTKQGGSRIEHQNGIMMQTLFSAQLEQVYDSVLGRVLPSAPAIVTDAALLAQFTQLPLALVKRWVWLDKYEVDAGNTLAVLFTAWHDAQPEPPSEVQCKQLSDMLPLAAVSVCFHAQALQHLKWWRRREALTLHMLADQLPHSSDVQERWSQTAGGLGVWERARARAKQAWELTMGQLRELWDSGEVRLPPFYIAGYQLGEPKSCHIACALILVSLPMG